MARRKKIHRIGILTGGGDCPGLNAVIRATVTAAAYQHHVESVGILDGYLGLIEKRMRKLTPEDVEDILPMGGTVLGSSNRDNPFKYGRVVGGKVVYQDVHEHVLKHIKQAELDALVVIGGDGTLAIAKEFHDLGVPVVGVPKTIDNDIMATDISFGFDSALQTATDAIDKIQTTAESHHRVMVVEVMGRNAGWIALQSGIAGGADVILIPEIPFDMGRVCAAIIRLKGEGRFSSVVVVAEGAHPVGGDVVVKKLVQDGTESRRLGGIGTIVGETIERTTDFETRVTTLGHIQRGGSPSPFDRILGTRFGTKAVELIMKGQFGMMACLKSPKISAVPLKDAVGAQRLVDPNGEMVETARTIGVSFGD